MFDQLGSEIRMTVGGFLTIMIILMIFTAISVFKFHCKSRCYELVGNMRPRRRARRQAVMMPPHPQAEEQPSGGGQLGGQPVQYDTMFKGPVKVLVDSDFGQDGSFQSTSDLVVIMIYASWCGHCQTLKPTYAELAQTLKGKATFTSVQLDAQEPERKALAERMDKILPFKFEGIPAVVCYKNGKFVANYEGDRSFESLSQFVEKAASA